MKETIAYLEIPVQKKRVWSLKRLILVIIPAILCAGLLIFIVIRNMTSQQSASFDNSGKLLEGAVFLILT